MSKLFFFTHQKKISFAWRQIQTSRLRVQGFVTGVKARALTLNLGFYGKSFLLLFVQKKFRFMRPPFKKAKLYHVLLLVRTSSKTHQFSMNKSCRQGLAISRKNQPD